MKPRTRTETRWVIVGAHGLYVGQWITRGDAIQGHVEGKGVPTLMNGSVNGYRAVGPSAIAPFANLRDDRATAWTYWQKQGDRAVKATITWTEGPRK